MICNVNIEEVILVGCGGIVCDCEFDIVVNCIG